MQFSRLKRDSIVVHAESVTRRVCFSIAIVLLTAPPAYRAYGIYRADRIVRSEQTEDGYSRALKYDPSNARLWWMRGRLIHYNVGNIDVSSAAADYERALTLNPRLSQAWVDLSDFYERTGNFKSTEAALRNALATRAYSPMILWYTGNYYLRRGNLPKMYECFKLAGGYDGERLRTAIELAWKIDPDHAGILARLVPDDINSNLAYLDFLVGRNELDLARPVWQRSLKNEIPAEFDLKPSTLFPYIEQLLRNDRIVEALQVWEEVFRKAPARPADTRLEALSSGTKESAPVNLIWNGSFENEILRGGFDWRYPDTREFRVLADPSRRIDGLKSLRITFGDVNISSVLLSQIVPVIKPGPYRLDFYLQTRDLTTDQLPYIIVCGYPDAAGASGKSDFFPPTTDWRKISVPLVVSDSCKAVQLTLRRDRSSKFGNQIEGSLWLDGFVLRGPAAE